MVFCSQIITGTSDWLSWSNLFKKENLVGTRDTVQQVEYLPCSVPSIPYGMLRVIPKSLSSNSKVPLCVLPSSFPHNKKHKFLIMSLLIRRTMWLDKMWKLCGWLHITSSDLFIALHAVHTLKFHINSWNHAWFLYAQLTFHLNGEILGLLLQEICQVLFYNQDYN